MVKLNRTTEYGLMALSYIRGKEQTQRGTNSSAREIAKHFDLPFEILAKTLQRLKDQGVIASTYGTRGGYVLARDLRSMNFADFLEVMEGPQATVLCLQNAEQGCEYSSRCSIQHTMASLNEQVYDLFRRISLEEMTRGVLKSRDGVAARAAVGAQLPLQGEEP